MYRSRPECSVTKDVLRNFAKFAGKTCARLKLLACNFIKKVTLAQMFSCEFWEISKNIFFAELLWENASE